MCPADSALLGSHGCGLHRKMFACTEKLQADFQRNNSRVSGSHPPLSNQLWKSLEGGVKGNLTSIETGWPQEVGEGACRAQSKKWGTWLQRGLRWPRFPLPTRQVWEERWWSKVFQRKTAMQTLIFLLLKNKEEHPFHLLHLPQKKITDPSKPMELNLASYSFCLKIQSFIPLLLTLLIIKMQPTENSSFWKLKLLANSECQLESFF